jgi:LPPG:FO 2-phospho-L-lactate transferase
LQVSAATVAQRYADLLDGYVVDHEDAESVAGIATRVFLAGTLMTTLDDREALAQVVLAAADELRR